MRKRFVLGIAMLVLACADDSTLITQSPAVATAVSSHVDVQGERRWSELTDDALWSSIVKADSIADVGLRRPSESSGLDRGQVILNREQRAPFVQLIRDDRSVRITFEDTLLPLLRVRVSSLEALKRLRQQPFVTYVEPNKFVDQDRKVWSGLGCKMKSYSGPGGSTTVSPGDILPWNYSIMSIDKAWTKSNGSGALIGLVDTGVDASQPELKMPGFASGITGKTITLEQTDGSTTGGSDACGHGTRMAGVIAAPKNGFLTVGVAWGASIFSVRVDSDVALTDVEAIRLGIRRVSDVGARIISLAFGTTIVYSSLSDEIAWHYHNRDRLFFAAAGTSACYDGLSSVMFPGSLPTVTTVTALDNTGAIACNAHYGIAVDFAAFSDQPTTGWWSSGGPVGISGSSNATALLSGIAALIVSARPSSTREQILVDLTNAASPTSFRSNDIGWGSPNALCAVRGMCRAWVDGTSLVAATGTYPFTARQGNSQGPFSYLWSTGETTQTIQRQIDVTYATVEHVVELQVTITDLSDGTQKTGSRYVTVRNPNAGCPECP